MDDRILYSLLGCSIPPPCPLGPPPDGANLLDDIEHLIKEIEIEPKLSQGNGYDLNALRNLIISNNYYVTPVESHSNDSYPS